MRPADDDGGACPWPGLAAGSELFTFSAQRSSYWSEQVKLLKGQVAALQAQLDATQPIVVSERGGKWGKGRRTHPLRYLHAKIHRACMRAAYKPLSVPMAVLCLLCLSPAAAGQAQCPQKL